MESIINHRNYLFDNLKFLLIFLVVWGHMMEFYRGESCNAEIYTVIYLFHMPLFIFISGFFSKKCTTDRFRQSIMKLLVPFVFMYVGSFIFKLLIYRQPLGLADFVIPPYASWYLVSLMCWRFMLQIVPDKYLKSKYLLPVCLVICILSGFIPIGGAFSIQRTFSFLPFFVAGYIVAQRGLIEKLIINKNVAWGIVLFFTTLPFLLVNLFSNFTSCMVMGGELSEFQRFEQATYTYFKYNLNDIYIPILGRICVVLCASLFSISLISIVPSRKVFLISEIGKNTLFYYVYHSFVFRLLLLVYGLINIPTSTVFLFIGSIVVMLIINVMERFSIFRKALNPMCYKILCSKFLKV